MDHRIWWHKGTDSCPAGRLLDNLPSSRSQQQQVPPHDRTPQVCLKIWYYPLWQLIRSCMSSHFKHWVAGIAVQNWMEHFVVFAKTSDCSFYWFSCGPLNDVAFVIEFLQWHTTWSIGLKWNGMAVKWHFSQITGWNYFLIRCLKYSFVWFV